MTHDDFDEGSKALAGVSNGWPIAFREQDFRC